MVVFCVSGENKWQSSRREVNDEVALNGVWRLLLVRLWTFYVERERERNLGCVIVWENNMYFLETRFLVNVS